MLRLPSDIMDIVLKYCDTTTRLAVLLSCRDYHAMAVPHVYRSITIRDPRQLRSFISIAQQAEFDGWCGAPRVAYGGSDALRP